MLTPLPVLIPDAGGGRHALRGSATAAAARDRRAGAGGGAGGVLRAGVPRRPRRHLGRARRRMGADRARHGAAGHHAGGGPTFGTHAGGVDDRAARRGDLRHRAGHPRRRRAPARLDLPAHLPGAVGGRLHGVPRRRPVQPLRRVRGAAVRELRAADHRRQRANGCAPGSPTSWCRWSRRWSS